MESVKWMGINYLRTFRYRHFNDAVMFDIDNTLLDRETGEPIQPMIDLLNEAKNIGYKIVILTARPDDYENQVYTSNQLKNLGITYNTLGYCPAEKKSQTKQYLRNRFVLSVGDYWTDLTDSMAWIKLPDEHNPNIYSSIKLA